MKKELAYKMLQVRLTPTQKEKLKAIVAFHESTDSEITRRLIFDEYRSLVKSGDIKEKKNGK